MMKTDKPIPGDEPLSTVLRSWKVAETLPPRFRDGVWTRIAQAEASQSVSLWKLLQSWFDAPLPRPALAAAYLGLFLMAGMGAGYWQGHRQAERMEAALGMQYLSSINPYQAIASTDR